jgi:hypothetical protein
MAKGPPIGQKAKELGAWMAKPGMDIRDRMRKRGATTTGERIDELMKHELAGSPGQTDELFGIALSGGGIRSATYSLGLMQGLARHRWLSCFDYMSTVSGGGYIGAFWSAWRARNPLGAPPEDQLARQSDTGPVRHLREFSNYLSPRSGLFSYDSGRLAMAPIVGTVPSVLIVLSLILLMLTAWSFLAWVVVGEAQPALTWMPGWVNSTRVILVLTALAMIFAEVMWYSRERGADRHTRYAYFPFALAAILLTSVAWGYTAPQQAPPFVFQGLPLYRNQRFGELVPLLSPAMAWASVLLMLVVIRALCSPIINSAKRVQIRAAADRVGGRLVFLIVVSTVPAIVWSAGQHFYANQRMQVGGDVTMISALIGSLTGLFVWARALIGRNPSSMLGETFVARLRPQLPKLLAGAVVLLLFIAMSIALAAWQDRDLLPAVSLVAGVIVAVALVTFHPNRIGLHSFYRSRLTRAYLGASNPATQDSTLTEEAPGDELPLTDLAKQRPVHLICCAANDLTPTDPLAALNRGAVSAVLSPFGFSVGHAWKLWNPDERAVAVGAAITASGAAFNSMMGSFSKQLGAPVVFLMATLNLRLGMWLHHPHAHATKSKEWLLPGVLFFKELFGISNAARGDVHLSDGGHFENMGLYELLRRRCRYILAADCGADPKSEFNDLATVARHAREDFGIEIEIDVDPLRPKDGVSERHFVPGKIRYNNGTEGVLLLFKPGLTDDEPIDVEQYRTRNPAFPAESTGDQFYDEAQWESYRRLGLVAIEKAFGTPAHFQSPAKTKEALRRAFIEAAAPAQEATAAAAAAAAPAASGAPGAARAASAAPAVPLEPTP